MDYTHVDRVHNPNRLFLAINGIYSSGSWEIDFCNMAKNLMPNNNYFGVRYFTNVFKIGQPEHVDKVGQNIIDEDITDIVAHSYGVQLVRLALKKYSNIKVANLWLIAGADYPDFRHDYNDFLVSMRVQKITCFTSHGDWVLANEWLTPSFFGQDLGYVGPKHIDYLQTNKVKEWRNDAMGHDDWVDKNVGLKIITPMIVI